MYKLRHTYKFTDTLNINDIYSLLVYGVYRLLYFVLLISCLFIRNQHICKNCEGDFWAPQTEMWNEQTTCNSI